MRFFLENENVKKNQRSLKIFPAIFFTRQANHAMSELFAPKTNKQKKNETTNNF